MKMDGCRLFLAAASLGIAGDTNIPCRDKKSHKMVGFKKRKQARKKAKLSRKLNRH